MLVYPAYQSVDISQYRLAGGTTCYAPGSCTFAETQCRSERLPAKRRTRMIRAAMGADIPRSDKTPNGNKRVVARWRARTAQGVVWAIALLGMFGIVGALCWVSRTPETPSTASSGEVSTLLETGTTLETEITRTVRPAIERTEILAKDVQLVQLLSANDVAGQTAWLNRAVTTSTEVDALALFDSTGKITAINTQYADGKPISSARVGRILAQTSANEKSSRNAFGTASTRRSWSFRPTATSRPHCSIRRGCLSPTRCLCAIEGPGRRSASSARVFDSNASAASFLEESLAPVLPRFTWSPMQGRIFPRRSTATQKRRRSRSSNCRISSGR